MEAVLARPQFLKYAPSEALLAFVEAIRAEGRLFAISAEDATSAAPRCRDPKDDMFLTLAEVARAEVIVSSDKDLLVLHPWRGIPILTPAQFVQQFSK